MKGILTKGTTIILAFMLAFTGLGCGNKASQASAGDAATWFGESALLLTFAQGQKASDLTSKITIRDDKGKKIDSFAVALSDKEVVITGFGQQVEKIAIDTPLGNYTVGRYDQPIPLRDAATLARYQTLQQAIRAAYNKEAEREMLRFGVVESAPIAAPMAETSAARDASGNAQVGQTNVQVLGIDEGDQLKNDGQYLYTIDQENYAVVIVKATGMTLEKVGQIDFTGEVFFPEALYLYNKQLLVLGTSYDDGLDGHMATTSTLMVYDLQNVAKPTLLRTYRQDGSYSNSRLIGETFYLISNTLSSDQRPIPMVYDSRDDQAAKAIDLGRLTLLPQQLTEQITLIGQIHLGDLKHPTVVESFIGGSDTLYMSHNNLYMAYQPSAHYWWGSTRQMIAPVPGTDWGQTKIAKFNLTPHGVTYQTGTSFQGQLINQFALDEYDDHLRIAYTSNFSAEHQASTVAILDKDLQVTGKINGIAKGERIYSVRFMGAHAYLVTFKQVDPFFLIDLKDPAAPKILGELKIPGYSTYLHELDDNHVLGIGRETYDSGHGIRDGAIKLAVFDITDPANITQSSVATIGNASDTEHIDSEGLYNHKAILVDGKRNLFGLATQTYKYNLDLQTGYQDGARTTGAHLYQIGRDFTITNRIDHTVPLTGTTSSGFQRLTYIGDTLYAVAPRQIDAIDMAGSGFASLHY